MVSPEERDNLALENDYIIMETSCFKNTNVANAFETLIELTNIELKKIKRSNSTYLESEKGKKHKKTCC